MPTSTAKHRLLLVDGDPNSLRVLAVSLKKAGFEVSAAANGLEALAALEAGPELIVADTHMPEMDGFELCRRIRQRPEWARTPFIFLSGRKSTEEKVRALELGVDDYLAKPIYIKELVTRVQLLLQKTQREGLESRRDPRTRFSGDLSEIGVADLVQTVELNRKSGIIHLTSGDGRRGDVFFRDGQIIDAEAGRLSGAEAVYRLFSWTEGTFEVEFKAIRRRDVIELAPQALLMEGMRRLDEWTRVLETMPPLDTVFEVDYHLLANRLADLPDEVNGILRLFDGRRTLEQVIEDCDFPDLEALTVVGKLHADRIIRYSSDEGRNPGETPVPPRLERWLTDSGMSALPERNRPPSPEERRVELEPSVVPSRPLMPPPVQVELERPRTAPTRVLTPPEVKTVPLPPPPEPRPNNRGDIIPFPAPPMESPPAPEKSRGAAVAHAESVAAPPAPPPEPPVVVATAHVEPPAPRPLPPAPRPPMRSTTAPVPVVPHPDARNPFDVPEDTLITALASARKQRAMLFIGFVVVAVIALTTLILVTRPRPVVVAHVVPTPAPVAVAPPPPPVELPAPVAAVPPPAAAVAPPAPQAAAVPPPAAAPPAAAVPPPAAAPPAAAVPPPAPAPVAAAPAPVPAEAPPPPAAIPAVDTSAARADCVKAYAGGRGKYKAVVAACQPVVDADPAAADVMVMLANAELERGRTKESMTWAQKALAVDPGLPDPYVFIGNAEQAAGHRKEARAAYEKYLEIAPSGPYAGDLRAVLKRL